MPDTQGVALGYVQVALSGRTFSSGLMYAICYTYPKSKVTKEVALGIDEEQRELCQVVCGKDE